MKIVKACRLRRGDVIGLIAPAGPVLPADRIERGVRYLEGEGYRVRVGAAATCVTGYFAGSDAERLKDLNSMFRDPAVRMVMALRGGYGTMRLLDGVDFAAVRRDPKIIVGFSDLTALQSALWRRCGLVTFAGPMAAVEFAQSPSDSFTEESFWRNVTSAKAQGTFEAPELSWIKAGQAEGRLVGGNLSVVAALQGTRYSVDFRKSVVLLEEVDEAPYRVDRLLQQLRLAGAFKQSAGVLLGAFTSCEPKDASKPSRSLAEVLAELGSGVVGPVAHGLPHGHVPRKLTLPLGTMVRLKGSKARIVLTESGVV